MKPSGEHLARIARVEAKLGDKVVCDRCGAKLADIHKQCTAPLDMTCPGFEAIDKAGRPE